MMFIYLFAGLYDFDSLFLLLIYFIVFFISLLEACYRSDINAHIVGFISACGTKMIQKLSRSLFTISLD